MREKICLFAGTTEGRQLAELLSEAAELTVCVATEYGEVLLDGIPDIEIRTGRMTSDEMAAFFRERRFSRILDATHPYAALVTENIREAAEETGIPVMRILRDCDGTVAGAEYVPSVEAARDFLMEREGRIFLTTGAKELSSYIGLDMERVWARVLPTPSSLEACAAAGIPQAHIIAAQGPFSEEINLDEMKQIGARYMVTKASGKAGGFDEKIRAAKAAGVLPVIVGLPDQTEGVSLDEAIAELSKTLSLPGRRVTVIGIGPGGRGSLTEEAKEALFACDAVIGARSVAESAAVGKPLFLEFLPEKIRALLDGQLTVEQAADQLLIICAVFHGMSPPPVLLDEAEGEMFPSPAKNSHSLRRAR